MKLDREIIDSTIYNRKQIMEQSQKHLYSMIDKGAWHTLEYEIPFAGSIELPNNYAIYVIESDRKSSDVADLFKEKKTIGSNHYSRNNRNESNVLYVGSSQHLKQRIQQHIGVSTIDSNKNRTTYALWLNDWFTGRVKVHYFIFSEKLDQSVLQTIEDVIWEINKPQFGKQGGK
jgi:hypothetical protein